MADDFDRPNGLAFSADERVLYVSDTGREPQAHPRASTSATTARCPAATSSRSAAPASFDGFRLDEDGRIWTSAGDGVHCYARTAR